MSKRFSQRIIDFLSKPEYQPIKARKLAVAMSIAEAEFGDFHDAVDALRRTGRVVLGTGNAVMLSHAPGQIAGTYRANPRGFGFVVPDVTAEHGDLFIPPGESMDALTGDKVLCAVMRRKDRDGKKAFGGRILKIVERGQGRFVGELARDNGTWYVKPDGNMLHVPIMIGDPSAKTAKLGDQVVVEIVRYPSEGLPAQGVIVERLGTRGDAGVDRLGIIRQFHIPDVFPEEVFDEARKAVRSLDETVARSDREDLSNKLIITIDPETARDFDDAISLERLSPREDHSDYASHGKEKHRPGKKTAGAAVWELGVHIADVSTFVTKGSSLDAEAEKRGTSVYFPGYVVPMLPEVLSNGVCSLQENQPRLCKSAFIKYDADGKVVGARFANTIIRSAKRFTYEQVTAILEGGKSDVAPPILALLHDMEKLARVIRERRLAQGMIVLDLPAVDLILNEDGRVVDAAPEDTSFSHTLIEMFMVEANEAVARLFRDLNVPFIRRIHGDPDEESLEAMARFVQAAGMKMPKTVTPHDLQKLLAELRGKPQGYTINLAVLKSMEMAEYSPRDVGHFALASQAYTHFTSPIRRYPDLMIHRLLQIYLDGKLSSKGKKGHHDVEGVLTNEELMEYGKRMSYLSRRAESAERELKTLKVLELLTQHLGEVFQGIITGITNFGMFVQHPKYLIEGLLRLEDLEDDWWEVDVAAGSVRGARSGRVIRMGNRIEVQIASIDMPARQLNLATTKKAIRSAGTFVPETVDRRDRIKNKHPKRAPRPGRRERISAKQGVPRGPRRKGRGPRGRR